MCAWEFEVATPPNVTTVQDPKVQHDSLHKREMFRFLQWEGVQPHQGTQILTNHLTKKKQKQLVVQLFYINNTEHLCFVFYA